MIDIHTHILPCVDDGANSVSQAIALLRQAEQNGTTDIVLTPHCAPAYGYFSFDCDFLEDCFRRLSLAMNREGISLRLYPGMEVLYEGPEEFALHAKEYVPLAGSRYLLVEFFFDTTRECFLEGIGVARSHGFVPIVAHPERYICIDRNISVALNAREQGALLQINKGSLSGRHGQLPAAAAHRLLQLDAVDFIASDAHHPEYRSSRLDQVFRYIQKEFGFEKARQLFWENPQKVLQNCPMGPVNP